MLHSTKSAVIYTSIDVYEFPHSFVLVAHEGGQRHLLHVSRTRVETSTNASLLPPVTEDPAAYDEAACSAELRKLADTAGVVDLPPVRILRAAALLGLVRFLEGWHMLFVIRSEVAGMIGGHAIHRIEETAILPVSNSAGTVPSSMDAEASLPMNNVPRGDEGSGRSGLTYGGKRLLAGLATRLQLTGWGADWAEARYRALFSSMDLTRDFYFSYTYDLTNTLQTNVLSSRTAGKVSGNSATFENSPSEGLVPDGAPAGSRSSPAAAPLPPPSPSTAGDCERPLPRDRFVWNHHLAFGLYRCVSTPKWIPPIVHGFFLQLSASLFGRLLTITLIARRSRLYAGARLLKRGLCENGDVANEVEVEQIVSDGERGALDEGGMTAAVQLRGSIPLVWGHGEQKHMVPRPDIHLQSIDPRYEWTLRHLNDLHARCAALRGTGLIRTVHAGRAPLALPDSEVTESTAAPWVRGFNRCTMSLPESAGTTGRFSSST